MVRRLVLADLSVEVVRSEQGIEEGPGQPRAHSAMDGAVVPILPEEQRMGEEGAFVLELLIGIDDEGLSAAGRAIAPELVEELGEGSFEGLLLEVEAEIELVATLFLAFSHGARSAERGVSELQGEEGSSGDGYGDVVGEVLGSVEADEAIDADLLVTASERSEQGMAGDLLTGKTVQAIEDRAARTAQETG